MNVSRTGLNRTIIGAAAAAIGLIASAAEAQITVFNDRAAWLAAAAPPGSNVICKDVENDMPGNYPMPHTTAGGWNFASIGGAPITLTVVASSPIDGTQAVHFRDSASTGVGVRPPCQPVAAAGFDFSTGIEQWTVTVGGMNFPLPTNTTGFFGFIASPPAGAFALTAGPQPHQGIFLDNLCCAFPGDDPCRRDSISLNTGFDHNTNAVYPIGSLDALYEVLHDPDPGTSEPRPAGVILKHPAWANPDPNSQWLGAYATSQAILNGPYVFQTCFCLEEGFQNVSLVLGCRADDEVRVYLNETLADVLNNTATPIHIGDGFSVSPLTFINFNDQSRFRVGRNCLIFRVDNTGAVAMGLNAVVTVNAPGGHVLDPSCCSNGSSISGQKWHDLNGDGIRQSGEPILPGWTININPGGSTTTDSNGFYYFNNLGPGTYVLSETVQSGWGQTFPTGAGTHTVNLGMNVAVAGFDFGNVERPCVEIIDKRILCEVVEDPTGQGGTVTGKYIYTFCFVNNTNPPVPIQYIGFTTPGVSPQTIAFPTPILPGQTSPPITLTLMPPAGATRFCWSAIFMNPQIEVCCQIEHCIDLPPCDCVQFPVCELTPTPVPNSWNLTFTAQNLSMGPINQLFLFPQPPGTATFTVNPPFFMFPNVPVGGTAGPFTVKLDGVSPGQTVCIRVSIHDNGMECCSEVKCFEIPGTLCREPVVLADPAPDEVCVGQTAMFSAMAFEDPAGGPMVCVWRRNGVNLVNGPTPHGSVISGATAAALTISNARPADSGDYDVMLGNECGSVATNPARLGVIVVPGDANLDNVIDFADITEVLVHFGMTVPPPMDADVNGDGVVNFTDLTTVLTNFGLHCP